jgi:hypothetical protein
VIFVEYHNGPEQTDPGRIDWQPGWYASCDDCGWSAGPYRTEAWALAFADEHAVAMGRRLRSSRAAAAPASGRRSRGAVHAPAAAKPSSSTSAACSGQPATAGSTTAATTLGRARSAAAPGTRRPGATPAGARTTGCASTTHDHRDQEGGCDEAAPARHLRRVHRRPGTPRPHPGPAHPGHQPALSGPHRGAGPGLPHRHRRPGLPEQPPGHRQARGGGW